MLNGGIALTLLFLGVATENAGAAEKITAPVHTAATAADERPMIAYRLIVVPGRELSVEVTARGLPAGMYRLQADIPPGASSALVYDVQLASGFEGGAEQTTHGGFRVQAAANEWRWMVVQW